MCDLKMSKKAGKTFNKDCFTKLEVGMEKGDHKVVLGWASNELWQE